MIKISSIAIIALFLTGCLAQGQKIGHRTEVADKQHQQNLTPKLDAEDYSLEKVAGSMLMIGFHGTTAKPGSQICKDIGRYNLAGVILFDYNPVNKSEPKNIASKAQLANLTKELQDCSEDGKLLISVDQEGGRVQRLKSEYGFNGAFPKASEVSKMENDEVRATYQKMGKELHSVGITYDLAPVVDLAVNPKNKVIYGLGRSFGSDPKKVSEYASIFIDEMHKNRVVTSLKHFPGHGSSVGDTHKGFVDVTDVWESVELEPYKILLEKNKVDSIMVAHVFNKDIDEKYPATLSKATVTNLLRKDIGYQGVVITDDLQMGAIAHKYKLRDIIKLAINAGDDILLFGNQLDPKRVVATKKLVGIITSLIESGEITRDTIQNANDRVRILKAKLN